MADRGYLPGQPLAHVIEDPEGKARCGRTPWPGRWLGLEGDEQRRQAYELTLCMGCVSAIRSLTRSSR